MMSEGRSLWPSPTWRGWRLRDSIQARLLTSSLPPQGPSGAGQTRSHRELPWACSPAPDLGRPAFLPKAPAPATGDPKKH